MPKLVSSTDIEFIERTISNKIPRGDFSTLDMRAVRPVVSKIGDGVYVEIGVRYGKSLTVAAMMAPEAKLYGIDIEDPPGRQKYFDEIGLTERGVKYFHSDSVEVAKDWKIPIDVLFIDGDHSKEGVERDIKAWSKHVKPGGWILFHDYDSTSPGVVTAVNNLLVLHDDYHNFFSVRENYMSSIAGIQKRKEK